MSEQPKIGLRNYQGRVCAIGPTDALTPATDGAQPVTLTISNMAGDIVWLKSRAVWSLDTDSEQVTPYADRFTIDGDIEIVACWIDETRLDQAPLLAAHRQRKHEQERAALIESQRMAAAMVPSCDNCGDCPQCC